MASDPTSPEGIERLIDEIFNDYLPDEVPRTPRQCDHEYEFLDTGTTQVCRLCGKTRAARR